MHFSLNTLPFKNRKKHYKTVSNSAPLCYNQAHWDLKRSNYFTEVMKLVRSRARTRSQEAPLNRMVFLEIELELYSVNTVFSTRDQ